MCTGETAVAHVIFDGIYWSQGVWLLLVYLWCVAHWPSPPREAHLNSLVRLTPAVRGFTIRLTPANWEGASVAMGQEYEHWQQLAEHPERTAGNGLKLLGYGLLIVKVLQVSTVEHLPF